MKSFLWCLLFVLLSAPTYAQTVTVSAENLEIGTASYGFKTSDYAYAWAYWTEILAATYSIWSDWKLQPGIHLNLNQELIGPHKWKIASSLTIDEE
jgi:hypothetical protein